MTSRDFLLDSLPVFSVLSSPSCLVPSCLVPSPPVLSRPLADCPVCKSARADLVFLVDGSWSIGDDNFLKVVHFLSSAAGALDQVGPEGTQVCPLTGGCRGLMTFDL